MPGRRGSSSRAAAAPSAAPARAGSSGRPAPAPPGVPTRPRPQGRAAAGLLAGLVVAVSACSAGSAPAAVTATTAPGPPTGPSATGPSTGPAGTGPSATGPSGTGPAQTGPAQTGPSATGAPGGPDDGTVTVGWSGDAVPASIDRGLPPDPGRLLGAVTPLTRAPDVMIGNLEGTLTDVAGSSKCGPGSTDCVAFRSPPAYGRLFAAAGYDVLSLANNHAHDHGPAGLAETRRVVTAHGIATTGGPDEIAVRTVRGIRVAVVGFAPYGWAAPLNDPEAVRTLVGQAARKADVVIVVFHGGAEGSGALHVPAGRETAFGEDRGDLRAFARIAVAAGADAVLGAGPHVVRGAEVVAGRPVAYSVGNLVGYRVLSLAGVLGTTAVLRLTFRADGSWVGGRLHPTRHVPPGYAEPDPARTAIALVARLSREDFGPTAMRVAADGTLRAPA